MLERQQPIQRLYQLILRKWVILSPVYMLKKFRKLLPTHVRSLVVMRSHVFKNTSEYTCMLRSHPSPISRKMPPKQTHSLSFIQDQTNKNNSLRYRTSQNLHHMRLPMYRDLSILQVRLQSEQRNLNTPSLSHEQKNLSTLKSPSQEPSWFP